MPFSAPDIDTGLPTAGDSLVASNLTMEVQALAAALEREKELRLQAEAHAVAAHTEAKFQAEMAEKDSDESAKQIAELARRVIELSAGHESAQRQLHSAMDKAVEFARRAAAAEEELDRMRRAAAESEVTQMAANIERLKRVANQKKQRAAELRAGQSQPQPEPEPEPELEQEPEPVLVLNSTVASAEFSAQLFAWLREELTSPKIELIYRASRDGWKCSDFHKLCDGRGPGTLTLVRTTQGFVFGGYLDAAWGNNNQWIASPGRAFLFSLRCHAGLPPTKMVLTGGKNAKAGRGSSSAGPRFGVVHGAAEIHIAGRANTCNDSYTCLGSLGAFVCPQNIDGATFLTGEKSFSADEVEVFCIHPAS